MPGTTFTLTVTDAAPVPVTVPAGFYTEWIEALEQLTPSNVNTWPTQAFGVRLGSSSASLAGQPAGTRIVFAPNKHYRQIGMDPLFTPGTVVGWLQLISTGSVDFSIKVN